MSFLKNVGNLVAALLIADHFASPNGYVSLQHQINLINAFEEGLILRLFKHSKNAITKAI